MNGGSKKIDLTPHRHLYPFKSRFFIRNGFKYHYIDHGKGEPIVMLHGNPTWSFYFRSLLKTLPPDFRAIAVDHIGCGLSDKPDPLFYDYRLKSRVDDFEAFIEYLELDTKLTLIVHDWGGMIGAAYAVRHPERISRMVIMNTAAFRLPKRKKLPFRLKLIRNNKPLAKIVVQGFNLFAASALIMATHKGLSRDVKAGLIAPYNSWKNRIATLKFVQNIPIKKTDPDYDLVKYTDKNLPYVSQRYHSTHGATEYTHE